jgi:threonine dehydratase
MIYSRVSHVIQQEDFESAERILAGKVHRTPLISSGILGKRTNVHLHFKAETFQKTGSFKPRGSIHKLYHLAKEDAKTGVITISSGNHAQGFAYAASTWGMPARVVMPHTTPSNKVRAAKGYGAEVILTDGDLLETALAIQKEHHLTMVHPFDDPHIVAGHGTIGLEILEDLPNVDAVFVPVGGGGLISGVAAAVKLHKPHVKIVGVEPIGASAMGKSLHKGAVVHLNRMDTVAEGLAAPFVGELNLALAQKYVDELVLVSDDEILEALFLILESCKLLAEPAGAAGFAGLLFNKVKIPKGSEVVCILSGGNVDRNRLRGFLQSQGTAP